MTAGKRRLAAIVAADVAAYSRLVSEDEEGTLTALRRHREELLDPLIESHDGRIANTAGDSLLIEFASAVEAVRCAMAMQEGMAERNDDVPAERQIRFRMGINVGDVLERDGDLLGEGVNVAARLEGLAEPGEIRVSLAARDQVRDRLPVVLEDLGEVQVKNIPRPVHVFRLLPPGAEADAPSAAASPRRRGRGGQIAAAAAVLALAAGAAVLVLRPDLIERLEGRDVAQAPSPTVVPAGESAPASPRRPTPAPVAALAPVLPPTQPAPPAAGPDVQLAPARMAAADGAPETAITPLPPAPEPQVVSEPGPEAKPEAEPEASPAAVPAVATGPFDGVWTGEEVCETGGGFYTRNHTFRITAADGLLDLEMTVQSVRGSARSSYRWAAALDPHGRADATTRAINGRRLPFAVDLSAMPGQIAFDGCVVALVRSADAPVTSTAVVPAPAKPAAEATAAGNGAVAAADGDYDGRWSAYFSECGTSFGGAPLFYTVGLRVRDGVYLVDLQVADTYETVRTSFSGPVGDNGRLVGRFETAMKTSETQTLRADLSAGDGAPWAAIDNCRSRLKPAS